MKQPWRTATIFISSTFKDMQTERDVINRLVLPALNERFNPHKIQIRLIDLRWGINTEDVNADARERHILSVCFQEIDRSRPFFIGLLGHRYGWIPSESMSGQQSDMSDNRSVTELEIMYGALSNEYCIQRSVFCIRNGIAGLPDALKETYEETAPERQQLIECLRRSVKDHLYGSAGNGGVIEYDAGWEGSGLRLPARFATGLTDAISAKIRDEFGLSADCGSTDGNEYLHSLMTAHQNSLCINTIGRDILTPDILHNGTIRFDGPPRCGKSVSMAQYALELEELPGYLPVYYATDMDTECRNPGTMLNYMCSRLSKALGQQWEDIADNISDETLIFGTKIKANTSLETLEHRLSDLCHECDAKGMHPVIIVDTPENLAGDRYRSKLLFANEHASVIIACGDGAPYQCELHIGCGHYSPHEASAAIDTYFKANIKDIHKSAKSALLECSRTESGQHSAGWLSLTMYWLANIGANDFSRMAELDCDSEESKIEQYLLDLIYSMPLDEGALLDQFILRAGSIFDPELSSIALTALALSPYGIEERELAAIAGERWDPLEFAKFRRWLTPFISESPTLRSWRIKSQSVQRSLGALLADKAPEFYRDMIRILMELPAKDPVRERDLPFYALSAGDFELCASILATPTSMTGEYFSWAMSQFPADRIDGMCRNIIAQADPGQRPAATVFLILMILLRNGIMPMRGILDIALPAINDLDPELYAGQEYPLTCLSCLWTELSFIARHYGTDADSITIAEALLNVGRIKYRSYPSFDSKQSLYKGLTAMAQHYMQTGQYERSMALYDELAALSTAD